MNDIYAGIDLGTHSIKIVVTQKVNDQYEVLASICSPSNGIKNGFITDTRAATMSIKNAVKEITERLGMKITKVVVAIPSENCKMDIVTGKTNVIEYHDITGQDVSNALLDAIKKVDLSGEELVTAIPIHFKIDDKEPVSDPKGMKGTELETKVVISTVPKEPLYRILEVLKLSGLEAIDIAYTSVGDYYTIKNRKFDELVGAIINIGEESTDVSVFNRGILIKNSMIPVGSSNVDKDITYAFKTKLSESKKMKEQFVVLPSSYADDNDVWELDLDQSEPKIIHQVAVSKVAEARVREILKLAKNEIKNLTNREIRYIMITGGLTELSGFATIVEQEFGFVAKVSNMTTMGVRNNAFTSCYGITKYFDDKLSLRGKSYQMFPRDEIEEMLSIDSSLTNENMISKVFGHFFDN